jgi:hypothetical protein
MPGKAIVTMNVSRLARNAAVETTSSTRPGFGGAGVMVLLGSIKQPSWTG